MFLFFKYKRLHWNINTGWPSCGCESASFPSQPYHCPMGSESCHGGRDEGHARLQQHAPPLIGASWLLPLLSTKSACNRNLHWAPSMALFPRVISQLPATRWLHWTSGSPGGSDGKEPACSGGDPGSTPGSGRSPGEGNGNPLQYSCLENSTDRGAGAWRATVHVVTKSQTRLSN